MRVSKVKITLMVAMFLCANVALAQHPILKKYADKPGVTRVYVSESMLNMVNENPSVKHIMSMMGLSEAPAKLTGFECVMLMNSDKEDFMKKDMKKIITDKHKELIQTTTPQVKIAVYGIGEPSNLSEMVVITENKETLGVMVMNGYINFNEVLSTAIKYMPKQ